MNFKNFNERNLEKLLVVVGDYNSSISELKNEMFNISDRLGVVTNFGIRA